MRQAAPHLRGCGTKTVPNGAAGAELIETILGKRAPARYVVQHVGGWLARPQTSRADPLHSTELGSIFTATLRAPAHASTQHQPRGFEAHRPSSFAHANVNMPRSHPRTCVANCETSGTQVIDPGARYHESQSRSPARAMQCSTNSCSCRSALIVVCARLSEHPRGRHAVVSCVGRHSSCGMAGQWSV